MSRDATRANYDRLSRWYDSFSSSERRFTETGLRLLDPKPDEAILEIGFGTGHALAALAQTARVWGIDLSPGMLTVTASAAPDCWTASPCNWAMPPPCPSRTKCSMLRS
jgi:ubiquinone/menaquinone biosynthesis C-methylase UbiE